MIKDYFNIAFQSLQNNTHIFEIFLKNKGQFDAKSVSITFYNNSNVLYGETIQPFDFLSLD